MRLRIAVVAAVLMAGMGASASFGEDAVLAEIYGRGVHAYFGRDEEAENAFTDAIAQGSDDPRCYYFRGLTFYQAGKLDQANADFMAGAKVEAKDVNLAEKASRSLTRVQGGTRMLLEKARQTARKEHRAAQVAIDKVRSEKPESKEQLMTRDKARYEELQSNEKQMLRTAPAPAVDSPAKAEEAKPAAEPAKEEPVKEEPAKEEPAKEEPKTDTPPTKPAEPAGEDPFGNKPAEPAKPATEPAKPAEPSKDPFGG